MEVAESHVQAYNQGHQSHVKTVVSILTRSGFDEAFPLTRSKLESLTKTMKQEGYRSIGNYLCAAKRKHI